MDFIQENKLLQFNPNTLEEVRRDVNLHRPGEMKEAVRILDEWIQQQPHFKRKDFPPAYLESSIVTCKGSIERAKKITDSMCTMRALHPRFFEKYDVRDGYKEFKDKLYVIVLPKPTTENYRICIAKFIDKMPIQNMMEAFYKQVYMSLDCLKLIDYSSGLILIYDLSGIDIQDLLTNFNFVDLKTFSSMFLECYGFRLKRLHMVTSSTLAGSLVKFCRSVVSKKIFGRCIVNKTAEELLQIYPKNILPKDYGGDERTLFQLQEDVLNELTTEANSKLINKLREATVDESLRPQGQFNELYAGVTGTFRALSVD